MAAGSKIEWTEATWNPVLGCTRVSPGCDSCYAITQARIRAGSPHPKVAGAFAGLTERRDGRIDWTSRVNLLPERLEQPFRWRKPRRVFVNSLADLFHKNVPDEFIARVFAVMAATPEHTYQLLTKQHARMRSLLSRPEFAGDVQALTWQLDGHGARRWHWPLRNVWLGVSVENQQWADIRIPALLDTPAAVRFLSCEPLLGPVNLTGQGGNLVGAGIHALPDAPEYDGGEPVCQDHGAERCSQGCRFADWVIAGGESGPGARPMHPDWARSLRDQCSEARVPFFFKQWGEWAPTGAFGLGYPTPKRLFLAGQRRDEFGGGEEIARVGKRNAGRVLDGRTWDEYPQAVTSRA